VRSHPIGVMGLARNTVTVARTPIVERPEQAMNDGRRKRAEEVIVNRPRFRRHGLPCACTLQVSADSSSACGNVGNPRGGGTLDRVRGVVQVLVGNPRGVWTASAVGGLSTRTSFPQAAGPTFERLATRVSTVAGAWSRQLTRRLDDRNLSRDASQLERCRTPGAPPVGGVRRPGPAHTVLPPSSDRASIGRADTWRDVSTCRSTAPRRGAPARSESRRSSRRLSGRRRPVAVPQTAAVAV